MCWLITQESLINYRETKVLCLLNEKMIRQSSVKKDKNFKRDHQSVLKGKLIICSNKLRFLKYIKY